MAEQADLKQRFQKAFNDAMAVLTAAGVAQTPAVAQALRAAHRVVSQAPLHPKPSVLTPTKMKPQAPVFDVGILRRILCALQSASTPEVLPHIVCPTLLHFLDTRIHVYLKWKPSV
jgi:hypothetical protein